MKKLVAIAALVMVSFLIAGIRGMSFENIPELRAAYGFYEALALTAASAIALLAYFHWKKRI